MSKDKNKLSWEARFRRTKKWLVGLTSCLAASTAVTTGLAIYYATRPNVATVNVNFHVDDDGILTGGNTQKVIKGSQIGQLPVPVKEASKKQIFDHWVDFDGTVYKTSDKITTNIDVYAIYKEAGELANTVTMEYNGGTIEGLEGNQVMVVRGSVIASLPSPVKDGAIFSHWVDAQGNPISPAKTIDSDITVYAQYKDVSSSTYLVDGKTLINMVPGVSGRITDNWKLMRGKTELAGATWSLDDKKPKGVSIDQEGYVSWDGTTPAGTYEVGISATLGDIVGTTNFAIVCANPAYDVSTSFVSESVHTDETKVFDDSAHLFILKDDQSQTVTNVTWALDQTITGISIATDAAGQGAITCTKLAKGKYSFNVNAIVDGQVVASRPIDITSSTYTYTLGGGVSSIKLKDNEEETTTAFTILQDGTTYTPTAVDWSVTPDTTITGTVEITNGAIHVKNVTAGTYTLTVKATWTDAAGVEQSPSATVTLVSESTKAIAIKLIADSSSIVSSKGTRVYSSVYPSDAVTNLEWSVSSGSGEDCEIKAVTGETGKADLTSAAWSYGTYTVTCEDTISGVTGSIDIKIDLPFINSNKIWAYFYSEANATEEFYWLNINDLCNESTGTIRGYAIGNNGQKEDVTYSKDDTSFNPTFLTIGDQVTAIPDNFCAGMVNFNSQIWFEDSYYEFKSKCTKIGKNFLKGCTSWNNGPYDIEFALPDSIQVIDDGFLDGCEAFNNGQLGLSLNPSPFVLPGNLTIIGTDFLNDCHSFNVNITIPSTVTRVGDNFMVNCYDMCSTLTINCDPLAFEVVGDESYSLSVDDISKSAYTNHVKIAGQYRDDFKSRFPNRPSGTYSYAYRQIETTRTSFEDCEWDTLSTAVRTVEYNGGSIDDFLTIFTIDGSETTSLDNFRSATKALEINGVAHTTKIIDLKHDLLATQPQGKTDVPALFSFEVSQVITEYDYDDDDDEYYASRAPWASNANNYDYTTSTLNLIVDTAIKSYLSAGFTNSINPVIKEVATTEDGWVTPELTQYTASLFAFTATELGLTGSAVEGKIYPQATLAKKIVESEDIYPYWLASPKIGDSKMAYYCSNTTIEAVPVMLPTGISFGFAI